MKGTFMKEKLSFQLKILLFILGEKNKQKTSWFYVLQIITSDALR